MSYRKNGYSVYGAEFDHDWYLPRRKYTPEETCALHVILQAIKDYFGAIIPDSLEVGENREEVMVEADNYIFGPDQDYEMSFETICAGLMMDAGYLRKGILRCCEMDDPVKYFGRILQAFFDKDRWGTLH